MCGRPLPKLPMLIFFDNGTPAPLRNALKGHIVVEAIERGWDRIVNGELLMAAETAGFELLLTTGKNMRYPQNLKGRKIAFVVIGNEQWPKLRRYVGRVVAAVDAATPGSYAEVRYRSIDLRPAFDRRRLATRIQLPIVAPKAFARRMAISGDSFVWQLKRCQRAVRRMPSGTFANPRRFCSEWGREHWCGRNSLTR